MDNTPQPETQTQDSQPIATMPPESQSKKKHLIKSILLWLLIILLLAGLGTLGYFYKTTNDSLKTQSQKLSQNYKTIKDFQAIIDKNQAERDFIAKYNSAGLSRNLCNGSSVLMSDVHVNNKFIVFRYLCANTSKPILIGAFAIHKSGPTDFTHSSTTSAPNALPSYIYNSEPDFFGSVYGATKSDR